MYTANPAPPRVSALRDYPYDALDDLLYDWALWERESGGSRGFHSASCFRLSGGRSGRQWRSAAEVLDDDVRAWQMQQVQACIDDLHSDHQLAIRIEMMNREGARVWRNPRAPVRQHAVYAEAKAAIRPMLDRRGVEVEC